MEAYTPFDRIFQSCGKIWHFRRADMDKLWEGMTEQEGREDRLPYWNEIWPSSLALAGWLAEMQDDIKDKNCLDIGCGIGFTALMGQWLGAKVTAMDYEPQAIEYARINEFLNGVPDVNWQVEDWREPKLPAESFDYVWAGDIMYEKEFAAPIAQYISTMLKNGGKAWIAEPRREIFHHLLDILPEYHLNHRLICYLPISPLTEQEMPVTVNIWQISKL